MFKKALRLIKGDPVDGVILDEFGASQTVKGGV
jgi:hypothetical protein